jgi:hypothetical protein
VQGNRAAALPFPRTSPFLRLARDYSLVLRQDEGERQSKLLNPVTRLNRWDRLGDPSFPSSKHVARRLSGRYVVVVTVQYNVFPARGMDRLATPSDGLLAAIGPRIPILERL